MPLTDQENNPIPMNGEHPAHDHFGTIIDVVNDEYMVTLNGHIVHPLNCERYMQEVDKAQVVRTGDY